MKKILSGAILSLIFPLTFLAQTTNQIFSIHNFDPKVTGFGFKNYGNDNKHNWKDDLGTDDLIRMVGVKATCKEGTNAQNCVANASARKWLEEWLKAIDKGRCTGMAVACLRFNEGLGFKSKTEPQLLEGAKSPFGIQPDQTIENYIAYYWLTQVFDEVRKPRDETAKKGPVEIAKMLEAAIESGKETYTMSIKKYNNGRMFDGHEFTPFAVEDLGNQYKIYVYDNNYPGETRFLFINKNGSQNWSYSSAQNQQTKPDYVGDINTQTLALTANSWRDGKCFDPPFESDGGIKIGCGSQAVTMINASYKKTKQTDESEDAEFFLTGDGDMLVTDGNGKRIGYDPQSNRFYNEFPDGIADSVIGGLGDDLPHFTIPYEEKGNPYTVVFSGKYLKEESTMDFVYSAPGFTVGFTNIRLDPNETLTATISPNGEKIVFTASADGETPDVFYAFDAEDDTNASYIAEIGGVALDANKDLTYDFDFENGKLFFSDDDGNEDQYDIDLIRINADGTEQDYEQKDLEIGKADRYEMDFGKWDGKGDICFKEDEDGDGFDDEPCVEEPNEKP